MKNPFEVAWMLDYAIRYWNIPQIDHVLGTLEEEERLLHKGVIVYPHVDLSGGELGELGTSFLKKVGTAIKKGVQKVGTVVKTVAQKVGSGVARFNPVSLAARGGLLLAIRTNLFKLADKTLSASVVGGDVPDY